VTGDVKVCQTMVMFISYNNMDKKTELHGYPHKNYLIHLKSDVSRARADFEKKIIINT